MNSEADAGDASPGDVVCATASSECTLRAAIEETNALPGMDSITVPAGTYIVDSRLLVSDSLFLNGTGVGETIISGGDSSPILRAQTIEALICDVPNDRVLSYDIHGQLNGTFIGSRSGGLDIPVAATIQSGSDDIFVAGFTSGIHRYDPENGTFEGLFVPSDGGGTPLGPTDLVFPPPSVADGDLLVTSFQPGGGIRRFDAQTGAFIDNFIPAGSGGLAFPNSIEIHDGDIYITSTGTDNVLRFDGETGAFIEEFVTAFSGGLSTPRDLLFEGAFLYVASEDNDRILRYDAMTGLLDGQFVTPGSGGLDEPTDIAFGPDGNFYVLSSGTDQILRYDGETGAFIDVFVEGGTVSLGAPGCIQWRDGRGDGPIVNVSSVSLVDGGDPPFTQGSGLSVDNGALVTLSDSEVRDNESRIFGGGISNRGNLTMRRTGVTGNKLPEGGGGVTSQGGGIFNGPSAVLTIEESLIHDNFATRGGGISNNGQLDIINSTVSGNRALGGGGGLRNAGSAVANITFSTITDNRANEPGGSDEPRRFGGGIQNLPGGQVNIGNTIIAKNTDNRFARQTDFSPDCYSPEEFRFTSHRNNLVGILTENCDLADTIFGGTRFDKVGTPDSPLDPLLGPLADNGGPTFTHALLSGSPAIDSDTAVTSASFFDCLPIDQRGFLRPVDGDDNGTVICDIGAFEVKFCNEQVATIVGTPSGDEIIGTDGPDVIHGLGGRDTIRGLSGDDVICGGGGNDTLRGGPDDDFCDGGLGINDVICEREP